jgi:hypothetical protein
MPYRLWHQEIRLCRLSPECESRQSESARGFASDALPFRCVVYEESNAISSTIDYAKFYSRSHDAVIRVFDETGIVIETQEHSGDFHEP